MSYMLRKERKEHVEERKTSLVRRLLSRLSNLEPATTDDGETSHVSRLTKMMSSKLSTTEISPLLLLPRGAPLFVLRRDHHLNTTAAQS